MVEKQFWNLIKHLIIITSLCYLSILTIFALFFIPIMKDTLLNIVNIGFIISYLFYVYLTIEYYYDAYEYKENFFKSLINLILNK